MRPFVSHAYRTGNCRGSEKWVQGPNIDALSVALMGDLESFKTRFVE